MILDGQVHFGCSFAAWPDHPVNASGMTMRRLYGSRKLDIPPLASVADVEPLTACVQQGLLVVRCPDCEGKPEEELGFVWRNGPHLFLCGVCGNAAVGQQWRPVAVLDARPDHRGPGGREPAVRVGTA
jgi:hypothetical protein